MITLTTLRLLPLAFLTGPASAALISQSWNSDFAAGGVVPDGNPVGWSDTRTLSGITATTITDVNVSLTITGGWNGDLYAYLQHSSGISIRISILLNRPGRTSSDPFGFDDSGMNIVFDDTAANGDSHVTLSGTSILLGESWQPDGRAVDPAAVLDSSTRSSFLSNFNGLNPNGNWTFFVADMSGGGVSKVTAWGLEISAVPEPSEALGAGILLGSALLLRIRPRTGIITSSRPSPRRKQDSAPAFARRFP